MLFWVLFMSCVWVRTKSKSAPSKQKPNLQQSGPAWPVQSREYTKINLSLSWHTIVETEPKSCVDQLSCFINVMYITAWLISTFTGEKSRELFGRTKCSDTHSLSFQILQCTPDVQYAFNTWNMQIFWLFPTQFSHLKTLAHMAWQRGEEDKKRQQRKRKKRRKK